MKKERKQEMRKNFTTKSIGNCFVLKTLTDLKWEKFKYKCEMAQLKAKYGKRNNKKLEEIRAYKGRQK